MVDWGRWVRGDWGRWVRRGIWLVYKLRRRGRSRGKSDEGGGGRKGRKGGRDGRGHARTAVGEAPLEGTIRACRKNHVCSMMLANPAHPSLGSAFTCPRPSPPHISGAPVHSWIMTLLSRPK
ncbi:hypothetical protein JB92DRAFT_2840917 [Gautieria morchelliformis]|nr:hypothetical protein JB92DRAFT_2840917 [Gautieria morchelliformis]